ncbi:MAG: tetratricopeptide repeat protein [Saprospiraceae bacterium]
MPRKTKKDHALAVQKTINRKTNTDKELQKMNNHQLKSYSNKSIAVLPFVNMSADPDNEYFSDGITEEIINALTTIQGLKVIARTSSFAFKGKNVDVRTIGSQLGVTTVLEGSVRKVKNRVRITAQLISTDDGSHWWSKNFDSELNDIFALQDEVSLLIADQIRENFGHFEIPLIPHSIPTNDIEAYDLVLKGNYYLKRKDFGDIKKAITLFNNAIQLDPNYVAAYSSLGEAYIHAAGFGMMSTKEAHELARKLAEKAIELNMENARGHKVLAYIKLFFDWDWHSALEEYDKAIKYGLPNQNEFIIYYYIFIKEDFERAIQLAKKAIETDPLHVITHWQLGLTYYFARRFEESIAAFTVALEVDPNFGEALRFRGLIKGYLGKFKEALIEINRAIELASGQGLAHLDMLVVKILMDKKEEVLTVMKNTEYVDSSDPAFLYSLLHMPDEAIYWLEKAYQERSVMMVTLKNFWVWDNLREDSRFQEIYDRMNFPPSIENRNTLEPINISQPFPTQTSLLKEQEIENYLHKLEQLINDEKIFIDPSLSLRQLADKMGLHPNKLSWLLNEHIGKNFNEYINVFRLETFKQKALNPNNSHLTLLGLAYESGFNSKTVFNAFFKKQEGMTPRAWMKKKTQ